MKLFRSFLVIFLVVLTGLSVMSSAQGRKTGKRGKKKERDSLVFLLSSQSAQTVVLNGVPYRKVVGPARFLHNGTYLLCDTALWNVDSKVIDAWGHVRILQDETVLSSDKLKYLVDQDLAQFRGSVVQLTDREKNTLRTRHLDYNTADSIAIFQNGAAMKDKKGQVIESRNGIYESRKKLFTFENDVNMFTDSVFVKTESLIYDSKRDFATFTSITDIWKDDNMLTANEGWYDKANEIFFFTDNVHVMTEDQEGWCDSLYFYRSTSDVDMIGNAQITDTTRNIFGLAGRIEYRDSLSKITMTRKPAVISETQNKDKTLDTVYLGARKLVYYTVKKCDVDSLVALDANKRIEAMQVDPVGEYRKKAAAEAAKAAEEAAKNDPNYRPKNPGKQRSQSPDMQKEKKAPGQPGPAQMGADSLAVSDSLAISDSLAVSDTVVVLPPKDTTKMGFLLAVRDVKVYKKDMQIVCDSLLYSDLDSLARFFKEPIIWQEAEKQYTADSIYVQVKDGAMEKASLMSNAFISIQEDSTHFDQIKGTEMLAYFDSEGDLSRFDVLGGASALFYVEENETLATVNKPESKMLSALLKDGEVQRIYYYDQAKNDGYPIAQLSRDEQQLKGFTWQPEKRPEDRNAVTPLSLRPSQRRSYADRPKATYFQTDHYFPGYMRSVYRQIKERDDRKERQKREKKAAEAEAKEKARLDSIAFAKDLALADSLARVDSLAIADSIRIADSLALKNPVVAKRDSLSVSDSAAVKLMTPEEIKAAKKAEKARKKEEKRSKREQEKKRKQDALEAKWEELDKRDAEKAAEKEAKRLAKERQRKRKALEDAAKRAQEEAALLEEYRQKFVEQKAQETEQ